MNRIITIGREFGSGGRELGRRLPEKLGFAYYDQEIISEIAEERMGKGQKLWGRLRSDAGWILLENVERAII